MTKHISYNKIHVTIATLNTTHDYVLFFLVQSQIPGKHKLVHMIFRKTALTEKS